MVNSGAFAYAMGTNKERHGGVHDKMVKSKERERDPVFLSEFVKNQSSKQHSVKLTDKTEMLPLVKQEEG